MSRLQSSSKQRRELQFACNVVAIKNEFKIILGTLNPVSTLNYLHYEGIVVSKEDFERHLSTSETNIGIGRRTDSVSSVEESKNPDDKWQQAARKKLTEIVDKKDEHKELRAIMIGLNPFKKLHQSAVDRRQTFQSPAYMATLLERSIFTQDVQTESEITTTKPVIFPGEILLAAFEHETHSLEELIQLLEERSDHCVISEVVNFEGKNLLCFACCMQPIEIVKTLVYNVQDNEENTALHEASRCRMPIVTNFIVNFPFCNPNILNSAEETPLHLGLHAQQLRLRSPTDSHREVPLDGQGSNALEITRTHSQDKEQLALLFLVIALYRTATTPVRPETKGILRPYNPESIRKSQLETVLEGLDDSSAEQSEVSLDKYSCNLLADTCFYSTKVSLRIGYFFVAIVLCLILLILLLYYFS